MGMRQLCVKYVNYNVILRLTLELTAVPSQHALACCGLHNCAHAEAGTIICNQIRDHLASKRSRIGSAFCTTPTEARLYHHLNSSSPKASSWVQTSPFKRHSPSNF